MKLLLFEIERFVEKKVLPSMCSLLSIFKRKKPLLEKNKEMVVIRLWALGESILCLPMIKALKQANPDSRITVLCTKKNSDVFRGQDFIDAYKETSSSSIPFFILKNFRRFDLAIDTEPHFAISAILSFFCAKRSIGYDHGPRAKLYDVNVAYNDAQHAVCTICDLLKPLGINARPKELVRLRYSQDAARSLDAKLKAMGINPDKHPLIGMHAFTGPSATWRAWPKERFAQLIGRIKERYGCTFILTGSSSEEPGNLGIIGMLKDKGDVFCMLNLSQTELFCLVAKYDLMIANDTGPMHVAAAQGVPTIGLFGPNLPQRFGPFPLGRNLAFYHPSPGHPVINIHLNEMRKCDGECMRLISVDEVFEGARKMLERTAK